MKKFNRLTLVALFVSILMLITVNTVYSGVNPPLEGAHWKGPAMLANVIIVDGGVDEYNIPQISIVYTGKCKGQEVEGQMNVQGSVADIQNKDDLLYFSVESPECHGETGVSLVANVIKFEIDDSGTMITAKVIVLNSVTK